MYIEATTVKQVIGWLVRAQRLPAGMRVELPMRKRTGTDAYCWRAAEVAAILAHCRSRPELLWLEDVLVALATTGMRIGELANLRRSDVDLEAGVIRIRDETAVGGTGPRRTTKSGASRSVPIPSPLRPVLARLPVHRDGYLFHGPRQGRLKPDTVRRTFVDAVLEPLSGRFPTFEGEVGLRNGRLHSFRHYFVSVCVQKLIPEQTTMHWVGHADSKMVKYYYHLHDDESRRQMDRLNVFDEASAGAMVV